MKKAKKTPPPLSSYQKLKKDKEQQKETFLRDIQLLLQNQNPPAIARLREKYHFLCSLPPDMFFGQHSSRAAQRLNDFLTQHPPTND